MSNVDSRVAMDAQISMRIPAREGTGRSVMPQPEGDVRTIAQIQVRSCSPIFFGRPPLGFGSSASDPRSLNAWITSRM